MIEFFCSCAIITKQVRYNNKIMFDINSILSANSFFGLAVLIISITIHECAHAAAANQLGDPTGKYAGRMTLNPIPHIDILGTIIAPLFFGIGWAKPVPFNPYNLKDQKIGPMLIDLAGAGANFALAIFFVIFIKVAILAGFFNAVFFSFLLSVVKFNVLLAVFNLMPIPPLDGSKILYAIIPDSAYKVKEYLERNSLILLIVFIVFFSYFIFPIADWIFNFMLSFLQI